MAVPALLRIKLPETRYPTQSFESPPRLEASGGFILTGTEMNLIPRQAVGYLGQSVTSYLFQLWFFVFLTVVVVFYHKREDRLHPYGSRFR